jgi:transposase
MEQFIGIDVHKKKCVAVVIDEQDRKLATLTFETKAGAIEKALADWLPAKVLIEATTVSAFVAGVIERIEPKARVVICDPRHEPTYAFVQKNDKGDATSLAMACRARTYKEVHRASLAARKVATQLEARFLEVKQRTESINFVRSKALEFGIDLPKCESERFHVHVTKEALPKDFAEVLAPLVEEIGRKSERIAAMDKEIEALRETNPVIDLLRTIVGPITAAMYFAVVDDVKRFKNAHEVEAYLGLVPREMSSGEKRRLSRITKRGNSNLRRCLFQMAASLLQSTSPDKAGLRDWAMHIMERRGWRRAMVALARKLAGILFAMWRDGKPFDKAKAVSPRPPRPARAYQLKASAREAVTA